MRLQAKRSGGAGEVTGMDPDVVNRSGEEGGSLAVDDAVSTLCDLLEL